MFIGSLSRPQDDDEIRAVVENLRRLVERKMNDMGDKPSLPGPSAPGPRRPKKMLMTFIDNYYGDFPGGNYTCRYIGFMGIKKGLQEILYLSNGQLFRHCRGHTSRHEQLSRYLHLV